jgi:hypothetical protein
LERYETTAAGLDQFAEICSLTSGAGVMTMAAQCALLAGRLEEVAVELTFVAKDPGSEPSGSPTLYRTDRCSWVVQGWVVTDPAALAAMDIPPGESCVEIPDRLVPFFTGRDR